MNFIKFVLVKYKDYKYEQEIAKLEPGVEEKDRMFMQNYIRCIEAGLTTEQIDALLNLRY